MDKEQMWDEVERLNNELRKWQNAAIETETDRNIIYGQLQDAKAEVERLNTGIKPEGSNDAVGRAVNVLLEKEKEIARLKAEVELWKLRSDNWQKFCQATKEGKQP